MPVGENYEKKLEELKTSAVIQASQLYHYKLIARSIGKTEETLIKWRHDDPDFSERLEKSRVEFLNRNIRRSKSEFLLERLEPEIFKQQATEVNIHLPSPILGGASTKQVEATVTKQIEDSDDNLQP